MNFVRFLAIKISPMRLQQLYFFVFAVVILPAARCSKLYQQMLITKIIFSFKQFNTLLPYPRSPNGNSSSLLGQFKIYQPECMLSISVFPIFFFFRTTARVSLVLLPLLGISWVFGVFAVNDDTVVFQYIFTISNSIQVWNQEELADRKNLHCCIGR